MAKRMTDTEKWKKLWFRGLPPEYKLFWIYLVDNCDHAGIWEIELDVCNVRLGTVITIQGMKDHFGDKIEFLKNGRKVFLASFIVYQYGETLNPDNRVHSSVLDMLHKEGATIAPDVGVKKPRCGLSLGAMDKDKAKDKENNIYNSYKYILVKQEEFDILLDPKFCVVFNQFLEFRKTVRKPTTIHAQRLILRKLQKEETGIAIDMLEQSIEKSWLSVYPIKQDQTYGQYQRNGVQQAPDAIKSQLPISRGGLIPDDEYKKLTGGSNG